MRICLLLLLISWMVAGPFTACVMQNTSFAADPPICYNQSDDDCSEYGYDIELSKCNTKACSRSHKLDENNVPMHQNGFYLMNYDCPAETKEPVVQTGTVYSCDQGAPEGEYLNQAAASVINCIKVKNCAASCNVTTEVEDANVSPKIRVAYCSTGGGPAGACAEEDDYGCVVTSQACVGDCPEPEPEP